MTKLEAANIMQQLQEADTIQKRQMILDALSDEQQYSLDLYADYITSQTTGFISLPWINKNFFNEQTKDTCQFLPNRFFDLSDTEALLNAKEATFLNARSNKRYDNYRCLHILSTNIRQKEFVTHYNEIYIDIDLHDNALTDDRLRSLFHFIEDNIESGNMLRPATWVFSGRGFGLHYLLDEPVRVASDDAITFVSLYQCVFDFFETLFANSDFHATNLIDRCVSNKTRVARCAGTYNTKAKKRARFVDLIDKRYSLQELADAFVIDTDIFKRRQELAKKGKSITKASIEKILASDTKQPHNEKQSVEKATTIDDYLSNIEETADVYHKPDSITIAIWKHTAKYECKYMKALLKKRRWIDGSKRFNYAFIMYNLLMTLSSTKDAAHCKEMLLDIVNQMEEPLSDYAIDRIVKGTADKIATTGHEVWFTLDTIVELLQIEPDVAFQCGFTKYKVQIEQAKANIINALERDRAIIELYPTYSFREIANILKEEHSDWKISKSTVERTVTKFHNVDLSKLDRTIYQTYTKKVSQLLDKDDNNNNEQTNEKELSCFNSSLLHHEVTLEEDNRFKAYIISKLCNGNNVFIHGIGGTGKTYLINQYITECNMQHKQVLILAPTGLAATNYAEARTVHSVMKLPKSVIKLETLSEEQYDCFNDCDVVIIDEISMIRCDIFDAIETAIKHVENTTNRRIQRIYCGDIGQLECVATDFDKLDLEAIYGNCNFMFYNSKLFSSIEMQHYLLSKNRRTLENETEYARNLQRLHDFDTDAIHFFNQRYLENEPLPSDAIILASHKATVHKENQKVIQQHVNDESFTIMNAVYDSSIESKVNANDFVVALQLLVFVGMRVMTIRNRANYINGTIGTVTAINQHTITLKTDNGKLINVHRDEFQSEKDTDIVIRQFPIVPAYAITIHKSQGLSLSKAIVYPDCFSSGQLYTALSRLRSHEGLYLATAITEKALKRDSANDAFLASLSFVTAWNYCDQLVA